MAIHADFVFEVRTTGDDTNGGGYKSSAGTTDYSQQDVAELSLTDCATSGTGVTTLTSVTGGFTAAMVGNSINLSAGTNLTTGLYEITAFTDANTVTLDRSPDDTVGGVSGATGKVGGALASPGMVSGDSRAEGNKVWIQSGTYAVNNATYGTPNSTIHALDVQLEGYETVRGDLTGNEFSTARPLIQASVSSIGTILVNGYFSRLRVDGGDGLSGNSGSAGYSNHYIHVENVVTGFVGTSTRCLGCKVVGATTGYSSVRWCFDCVAGDCTTGFLNNTQGVSWVRCIAYDCTTYGFRGNEHQSTVCYCIADNTRYGFYDGDGSFDPVVLNCIAINCSDYGFRMRNSSSKQTLVFQSASYNNGSRFFGGTSGGARDVDANPIVLTANPFVDSANRDYRINDADGGGKLLKGFGYNPETTDTTNISALLPSTLPGGTSGFYYLTHWEEETSAAGTTIEASASTPIIDTVGLQASMTNLSGGDWRIEGGYLKNHNTNNSYFDSQTSYQTHYLGWDYGVLDFRARAMVYSSAATGFLIRRASDGSHYMVYVSGSNLRLYYYDGTSAWISQVGSDITIPSYSNDWSPFEFQVVGDTVTAYYGGTEYTLPTMTNNLTETGGGLYGYGVQFMGPLAVYRPNTEFSTIYPPETVGRQPSIPHPLYMG